MNDRRLFMYESEPWVFTDIHIVTTYGTELKSRVECTYQNVTTEETRQHTFSNADYLPPNVTGDNLEHRAVYTLLNNLGDTQTTTVYPSRYNRLYTVRKENTVCRTFVRAPVHEVRFTFDNGQWVRVAENTTFQTKFADGARSAATVLPMDNPFPDTVTSDRIYNDHINSGSIYERIVSILTDYL